MSNLNPKEQIVLNAIVQSSNHNGGDFTYIDDLMHEMVEEDKLLSINQVKGYMSILQKKGYIFCCEGGQIVAGDKYEDNFNIYIGA
tara:strand:- start:130 stop:387 length:258 start_codon:yes stop_codon:yes gene_type:complete